MLRARSTEDTHRGESHGDYVVATSRQLQRRLGLGAAAVVLRSVSESPARVLRAQARVIVDESLDDETVAIDQTLRNAVGIPFSYDPDSTWVDLKPLNIPLRLRLVDRLNHVLGRRYLVLRVDKGDMADMETDMVRVRPDAFARLGCAVSSKIVIDSVVPDGTRFVLRRTTLRAYEWTSELESRRIQARLDELQHEKEQGRSRNAFERRFPDPEKALGVSPDIGGIYMDAFIRSTLGVESLDPVRVRRNLGNAFFREFREFGTVFFISLFGLTQIIPGETTWRESAIVLAIGLIVSLLLTLVNMRARGS